MAKSTAHTAMHYPESIPQALPPGEVLVHNHVRPARRQGTRGFRFWTQAPSPGIERCDCGWAGANLHGLDHYRVRRDQS